ncbi:basic proline-rich protein-like [Cavia porcellus]|uniref:basic proline-rich protein-like n=1 Tax=Cavia porcellus TaxID=10141 RepID=UPI002FE2DAD4
MQLRDLGSCVSGWRGPKGVRKPQLPSPRALRASLPGRRGRRRAAASGTGRSAAAFSCAGCLRPGRELGARIPGPLCQGPAPQGTRAVSAGVRRGACPPAPAPERSRSSPSPAPLPGRRPGKRRAPRRPQPGPGSPPQEGGGEDGAVTAQEEEPGVWGHLPAGRTERRAPLEAPGSCRKQLGGGCSCFGRERGDLRPTCLNLRPSYCHHLPVKNRILKDSRV